MDFAVQVFLLCNAMLLIIGLMAWTQKKHHINRIPRQRHVYTAIARTPVHRSKDPLDHLFRRCTQALLQFTVLKRHGKILICEKDSRGFSREIAFLSINIRQKKSIENRGAFFVVTYPSVPSLREIRNDVKIMSRPIRQG